MKRTTLGIALIVGVLASDRPAPAIDLGLGILNKRKAKADPPSRAKVLLETLRTDPDEFKRKAAATELRGLDPRNTPDLIAGLVSSLQRDPSPTVRIEAAESIGVMKPISQPAGLAMEAAMTSDPDPKVRDAVKSALWQYHLNGYRTPPSGSPLATQTTEPPIAPKTTNAVTVAKPTLPKFGEPGFRPISNTVGKGVLVQATPEPPLAKPKPSPVAPPRGPALLPTPMPSIKPEITLPAPSNLIPTPMPTTPMPSTPTSNVPTVGVPPLPTAPELPTTAVPLPSIPVIPIPTIPVPQTNAPTVPAAKNF